MPTAHTLAQTLAHLIIALSSVAKTNTKVRTYITFGSILSFGVVASIWMSSEVLSCGIKHLALINAVLLYQTLLLRSWIRNLMVVGI